MGSVSSLVGKKNNTLMIQTQEKLIISAANLVDCLGEYIIEI